VLSPAWWTGPPPIPHRRPPRATNRMTRPLRRSPPQEAARGFWIRAWGQREPTKQGTSRLSSRARSGEATQGWAGHPATHVHLNLVCIEHPIRTLTCCAWSRTTRVGTLRLVQWIPPVEKGAARGSSAHRTRPWPQGRCPVGRVGRCLKPQIGVRHEWSGFVTAGDLIRRPPGLPCSMADGPTPRTGDTTSRTRDLA
jgi:hypothetical protein